MATVTGLTKAAMEAIRDGVIVDAEVVGNNLILTKFDASTLDAGSVRGPVGPPPPVVSSLPTTGLTNLQEVYLQTSAMATAQVMWHMKYISAISKWIFLGGAPLAVEGVGGRANGTNETTTSLNSTTLSTAGPSITIPATGIYEVEAMAHVGQVGAGAAAGLALHQTGDGAVNWANAEALFWADKVDAQATLTIRRKITATAASVVELRYVSSSVTGGAKFRNRNLWVKPVTLS